MRFLVPVKYKLLVAGAGALVLAGLAVGASAYNNGAVRSLLTATKPAPKTGANACQGFVHHLAKDLGKSDSQTSSALKQAAGQTIDDAVAQGRLTAAQAARLKAALNRNGCSFPRSWGHRGADFGIRMEVIKAAAETLHLTPSQLMADVAQGKSISSLANGMTEAQFRTALIANLKTDLDGLVAKGRITQAQEDAFLARMQTAPIPFWSSGLHRRLPVAPVSPIDPGARTGG